MDAANIHENQDSSRFLHLERERVQDYLYKENLEDFRARVYNEVRKIHIQRFPYNHFLYPDYEEES